jgi:hypothetical protein
MSTQYSHPFFRERVLNDFQDQVEFQEKLRKDFHEEIKWWLNQTTEWSAGLITQEILNRLLGMCFKQAYAEAMALRKEEADKNELVRMNEAEHRVVQTIDGNQGVIAETEGTPEEVRVTTDEIDALEGQEGDDVEYFIEKVFREKIEFRGDPDKFEEGFFENYAVEAWKWCSRAPNWYVYTDQSDYREGIREKCMRKAWGEIIDHITLWEELGLKPGEILESIEEGEGNYPFEVGIIEWSTRESPTWVGKGDYGDVTRKPVYIGKTTNEVVEGLRQEVENDESQTWDYGSAKRYQVLGERMKELHKKVERRYENTEGAKPPIVEEQLQRLKGIHQGHKESAHLLRVHGIS